MDEIEIEVFRADPRAARGITAEHLAELASSYDGSNPVPVCIGHPKSDTPAHGEVSSFRVEGNSLFGTIKNLGQAVVDGVKGGKLLNRSMAFFDPNHSANPTPGKFAPRHLGFLGGSAPGIPNMPRLDKCLAYSADGETLEITGAPAPAVMYSAEPTQVFNVVEQEPRTMDRTPEQIAEDTRLASERTALETERTAFAAEQQTLRETANAGLVDGLVTAGRLLPADADALKKVFNALDPSPIEFSADRNISPAAELARLLGSGVKLVPIGGRRSPTQEFVATDTQDADSITSAARKLMETNKSLTFEAAVERVSTQQEG